MSNIDLFILVSLPLREKFVKKKTKFNVVPIKAEWLCG